jgi:hypothetical protein
VSRVRGLVIPLAVIANHVAAGIVQGAPWGIDDRTHRSQASVFATGSVSGTSQARATGTLGLLLSSGVSRQ